MVYVACVYAASRVQYGKSLPDWMQKILNWIEMFLIGADWLYNRFRRWWHNSALSTCTWALGWGMVFLLSTQCDWSTQHTRYGVSMAWAFPSFLIQWKVLWGDRNTSMLKCSTRWWGYWLFSQLAGNMGTSYIVVKATGWPFLLVSLMLMPYTTLLPYWVKDRLIFRQGKTATA